MKELFVKILFVILFDSVISSQEKTKRSLFQENGWSSSSDYENDELSDGNPWRTLRLPPSSLQSSEGLSSLGALRAGQPFLITKHILVDRPVPQPVFVEKKVAVPVEKIVPVTVERVVNKVVPVLVPHPIPYPVERAVQISVRQPVAVPVQQPYPVTLRQGVPYPVPVPLLVTPQGIIPALGALLPSSQIGGLQEPSPLGINAPLSYGTSGFLPTEGLIDTRRPDLGPELGQGNSLAFDFPQSQIVNDLRGQEYLFKRKRSDNSNHEVHGESSQE